METVIDRTANQIVEIRKLGQWEFLTVECEVMVDTVRPRPFYMTDDRLARIYKGAIRIGIDMERCAEDWAQVSGDSAVSLRLPPVGLLDDRFIDEANTVAFFEDGKWDAQAKEQMYARAKSQMLTYALSKENLETARSSAEQRFFSLFRALGFKKVEITFAE